MTKIGADLLIVEYRAARDLRRLLYSIHPPDDVELAVWIGIVDPYPYSVESQDVAAEFFADTGYAGDQIHWAMNVGYNRALNTLGHLGHHSVIGCLNADVILTEAAIGELVTATITNPGWGVIGPRQTDRNGRLTAGGIFGEQTKPRHRGWKARSGHDDVRTDAVYVSGAALFLQRDTWNELTDCPRYQAACHSQQGGPWLDTQHYYGDSYLSLHAQAHGKSAVYLGTTTIRHDVGGQRVKERDVADLAHFRAACDLHEIDHE